MYTNLIGLRDIACRWILQLYDIGEYFFQSSVSDFLLTLTEMLDKFPVTELLNIIIIPLRNVLDYFGVGQLTLFEFTLGGAIGIIVIVSLFKWLLGAIPLL